VCSIFVFLNGRFSIFKLFPCEVCEQNTFFLGDIPKILKQLATIQSEFEPYEIHAMDCQGKIDVAKSKSNLLKGKVCTILFVMMFK
jgi:hypothetical protein